MTKHHKASELADVIAALEKTKAEEDAARAAKEEADRAAEAARSAAKAPEANGKPKGKGPSLPKKK